MEGHTVTESQTGTAGSAPRHRSGTMKVSGFAVIANPRFWVLGTCIAVAATIYGYV